MNFDNKSNLKASLFVKFIFKVLISYIETAGSTLTRQKALKEQYLFTCTCPRCSKGVLMTFTFNFLFLLKNVTL